MATSLITLVKDTRSFLSGKKVHGLNLAAVLFVWAQVFGKAPVEVAGQNINLADNAVEVTYLAGMNSAWRAALEKLLKALKAAKT